MSGTSSRYERPDSAKEYFSFGKVNKSGIGFGSTVEVTLTAGNWAAEPNPSYVDKLSGSTIVCSGLAHEFGGRVGIVTDDTVTGTTGNVACSGIFLVRIFAGRTPAKNSIAYWDVSLELFTDNLAATTTGDIKCGYFVGTAFTISAADSYHLPAGDYCLVQLTEYQLVLP